MDCISLHQYGITNVVASLGTALTERQESLRRYADKIIMAYDADGAGQAATIRGMEILRKEGLDVRIMSMPSGKDPDEFIRANGKEAFLRIADKAMSLIDYKIKKAAEGVNFNDSQEVIKYIKKATEVLAELNPVEKDVYIKRMSQETGVKEQAIYDLLKGQLNNSSKEASNMNTMPTFGQKLYVEPAHVKAERNLLKLMTIDDECYKYIIENLSQDMFIMEGHKKVFDLIVEGKNKEVADLNRYVEDRCDDVESSKEWVEISNLELIEDDFENKQLIIDYISEIKNINLRTQKSK